MRRIDINVQRRSAGTRRIHCLTAVCSTFLALWSAPRLAQADVAELPSLVGGPDVLWLHQRQPTAGGPYLLRFAFRVVEGPGSDRYLPLPVPGLTGEIRASAVRGSFLHAVFSDGTHWRFAPTTPGWHTVTPPVRFAELNLPGSLVPRAMASDTSGARLFALVATVPEDIGRAEADAAAVLQYAGGAWTHDRVGPEGVLGRADAVALTVRDGTIDLFFQTTTDEVTLLHQRSAQAGTPWTEPDSLAVDGDIAHWTAGWIGDSLIVVVAVARMRGVEARLLSFKEGAWRAGPVLAAPPGAKASLSTPIALGVYDRRVVAVMHGGSGETVIGAWSAADGSLQEVVRPLEAMSAPRGPRSVRPAWQFLQYTVLALVFVLVFLRRRESILLAVPLEAALVQARLARRFAAFLADLAFTSPIWLILLYLMLRSGDHDMTLSEQLALGPQAIPEVMFWSWAVVGVVEAVYSGTSELLTRTTPGKRLVGCFVLGEDGSSCGGWAILIRNAARVIEFHFPPLVLLVVMTPNRQRLGDLLGRTIVVEARPGAVEAPQKLDDYPDEQEPTERKDESQD